MPHRVQCIRTRSAVLFGMRAFGPTSRRWVPIDYVMPWRANCYVEEPPSPRSARYSATAI